MKTLTYKERDLKKIKIEIGFQGENNRKKIQIDCAETFAEYPNAEISMKVQAPKGGIYPATVTREENLVSWVIRDCDVANKGDGEFQITFTEGQDIAKSVTGKFHVERSLTGSGTAPSGVQDWLDGAQKVLEDLEEAEVNQPCIGINGNWYVYNVESGEYVDTGVKAQGEDGDPGQPGTDATPDLITKDYADLTFPVAKDSFCYHDGKLYQAKQDIQTSEQWTAAHWTETTVEDQLNTVKSAINSMPTEETGQELLAAEFHNTGLTDTALMVLGMILNALPQDDIATDIMHSISLECERLDAIYENWMSERSA